MRFLSARRVFICALLVAASCPWAAAADRHAAIIRPGAVWLDNRGVEIQAHGGGILLYRKTYYWFGEDRSRTNDPAKRYVACYSSKDLAHWKFRGQVLAIENPENLGRGAILERPKVYYNSKTNKFVMYMHLDGPGYKLARVAIAVSNKVDGNYTYVKSFRPLGKESRDIGQFIDDDGSAYLIFESRPTHGFFIARLSADYMSVEKEMSFVHAPLEGGALVHYKGLYYVVGSHLTGWRPNPNVYATAPSLAGPWSEMRNIAPPEANTYNSQLSMLLKVVGAKTTTVIFMGDQWKPHQLWDSRYIWMPVEIGGGKMTLPAPRPWTIDVKTGETRLLDAPPQTGDGAGVQ
ncbi:MAG: family 43 glycosylhydrolase [Terracidiphilus sp.]